MKRFPNLIKSYDKVQESDYQLIFIQINEAHSNKWPLGLSDHPDVHRDINDRYERARKFVELYQFPYPVYVDTWSDQFENTYHAWPDQYTVIDCKTGLIISHSHYNNNALVTNDYSVLLLGE